MTQRPEVQIKAQEEIDRVFGQNRLLCFSDLFCTTSGMEHYQWPTISLVHATGGIAPDPGLIRLGKACVPEIGVTSRMSLKRIESGQLGMWYVMLFWYAPDNTGEVCILT